MLRPKYTKSGDLLKPTYCKICGGQCWISKVGSWGWRVWCTGCPKRDYYDSKDEAVFAYGLEHPPRDEGAGAELEI